MLIQVGRPMHVYNICRELLLKRKRAVVKKNTHKTNF